MHKMKSVDILVVFHLWAVLEFEDGENAEHYSSLQTN